MRYEFDGTEGSAIACVTNARYEITDVNRTGLPPAEHLISGAAATLPRSGGRWWNTRRASPVGRYGHG
jgi:hypothetical protein